MTRRLRKLLVLTLLGTMWPLLVGAQSPKAGVVTTLEGNVTARRVALADPVPLKFKDDVFLQDTVTTGDKSLARMLLGGKAVVTVRERSVLTITETPGRSTIELETGKFALAVARDKMRPGEEIQIRTPNAIAGVRGTVVVTEVNRQGAQLGGRAPAVVTNFYVLRGTITAQPLDPGTRQPFGAPLQIGTLQAYSGAGSATPRVAPVAPEQIGQINSGLQPSGPKGGREAGTEQVKTQAVQTAAMLLGVLAGNGDLQTAFAMAPGIRQRLRDREGQQSPERVLPAVEAVARFAPQLAVAGLELQAAALALAKLLAQLALALGQTSTGSFLTFSGPIKLVTTEPIADLNGRFIVHIGTDPLIFADPTAVVTMASTLMRTIDTTIFSQASGIVVRGAITDSTPNAFVQIGSSIFELAGPLIDLSGSAAQMSLAGRLVTASGSLLKVGNPGVLNGGASAFIHVGDGAVLSGSGTLPLINLADTNVNSSGTFFVARRHAIVTLAGPLLAATDSRIDTTSLGAGSNCCSIVALQQGSRLTSTSTEPLVQLVRSTLNAGPDGQSGDLIFEVSAEGTTVADVPASSRLTLAGPLLNAVSSTVSSLVTNLEIEASTVVGTSTSPLISLLNSTLAAGGADPFNEEAVLRRPTVSVRASQTDGAVGLDASLELAGPLLRAVNSTVQSSGFTVQNGAQYVSTTAQALVTLAGSTLTLDNGGDLGSGFFVQGRGGSTGTRFARMAVRGSLLEATLSSTVSSTGALVFVGPGGEIRADNVTDPLVVLSGGTHSLNPSLGSTGIFSLAGRAGVTANETVESVNLTLGTDRPIVTSGSLAQLQSGAVVSSERAVRLDTALLEASAPLFNVRGSSSLTTANNALELVQQAKLASIGPVLRLDASTFTVTSGAAISVNGGSLLRITGDLLSMNNASTFTISNGAVLNVTGGSVVHITGAFVNFGGGGGNAINVNNSVCSGACSSSGGIPFHVSNGATVSVSGTAIKNAGLGALNLNNASTAVIVADGANTKVVIQGN